MNLGRSRDPYLKLSLISLGAVFVHGYHLGTDDAAIYVPAVKKAFDPQLYPYGAEFFEHHGRLSIFSSLVSWTAKLGHMPIDFAIFLWHILGIFLIILAAWRLASLCFESARARWSAVLVVAAVLTVPVAGTALVMMDPYLTARSLSTPATMLAIASFMGSRWRQMIAWLALTAVVHPQNAAYGIAFCILMALPMQWLAVSEASPAFAFFADRLPTGFDFSPAHGTYHDVLYMRTFFFAQLWTWYEWIGVFMPMAILFWFSRITPRATLPGFRKVSRALIPFGILVTARISHHVLHPATGNIRSPAAHARISAGLHPFLPAVGRPDWRIHPAEQDLAVAGSICPALYQHAAHPEERLRQQPPH